MTTANIFSSAMLDSSIKLSDEQENIIRFYRETPCMRINAYAGTGKTTTLLHIAQTYPSDRFLILCFNRSVADEINEKAKRLRLKNVKASTIHSLAYSHYIRKNGGHIRIIDERRVRDVLLDRNLVSDYGEAIFYSKIYESYCKSEYIGLDKKSIRSVIFRERELRNMYFFITSIYCKHSKLELSEVQNIIYSRALEIIDFLTNYMTTNRVTTHSHYLKDFHIYVEQTGGRFPYDTILLDEAQDVNGIMLRIILAANVRKKVVVGDIHQSIYGWNGAINVLSRLNDWPQMYLTQSYRFVNPKIVDMANQFLTKIKYESNLMKTAGTRNITGQAYISYTNAELINKMMSFDDTFRTVRDLEVIFSDMFIADKIIDYYKTNNTSLITDLPRYIRQALETYNTLEDFTEAIESYDYGIFQAIRIGDMVKKRYNSIFDLYHEAGRRLDVNAPLTLTTAHTAKGLEWHTVYIAPDFPAMDFMIGKYVVGQYKEYISHNQEELTDNHSKEELLKRLIIDLSSCSIQPIYGKVPIDADIMSTIKRLVNTTIVNREYLDIEIDKVSVNKDKLIATVLLLLILANHDVMSDFLDAINLQYVAITRASNYLEGSGLQTISRNFSESLEASINSVLPSIL